MMFVLALPAAEFILNSGKLEPSERLIGRQIGVPEYPTEREAVLSAEIVVVGREVCDLDRVCASSYACSTCPVQGYRKAHVAKTRNIGSFSLELQGSFIEVAGPLRDWHDLPGPTLPERSSGRVATVVEPHDNSRAAIRIHTDLCTSRCERWAKLLPCRSLLVLEGSPSKVERLAGHKNRPDHGDSSCDAHQDLQPAEPYLQPGGQCHRFLHQQVSARDRIVKVGAGEGALALGRTGCRHSMAGRANRISRRRHLRSELYPNDSRQHEAHRAENQGERIPRCHLESPQLYEVSHRQCLLSGGGQP